MVSLRRTLKKAVRTASKTARLTKKTIMKNARKTLNAAGKSIDKKLRKGVISGIDKLSTRIAKAAGAASLLNGVKKFSRVIDKAVGTAIKIAKCAKWINNPVFWAIAGGLYAARLKGLVKKKKDCYDFIKSKKFKSLIGRTRIPVMSVLPCAIEVAFRTPRPR
jgi:hypothetical protein